MCRRAHVRHAPRQRLRAAASASFGVPLTFQLDSPGLCVILAFYYTALEFGTNTHSTIQFPQFTGELLFFSFFLIW